MSEQLPHQRRGIRPRRPQQPTTGAGQRHCLLVRPVQARHVTSRPCCSSRRSATQISTRAGPECAAAVPPRPATPVKDTYREAREQNAAATAGTPALSAGRPARPARHARPGQHPPRGSSTRAPCSSQRHRDSAGAGAGAARSPARSSRSHHTRGPGSNADARMPRRMPQHRRHAVPRHHHRHRRRCRCRPTARPAPARYGRATAAATPRSRRPASPTRARSCRGALRQSDVSGTAPAAHGCPTSRSTTP